MTKTYQGYKKTKHINMYHHFVKEKVKKGNFISVYIQSKNNISDLLTKLLLRNITRKFAIDLDIYSSNKEKQNNKMKKITIISGRMLNET